jgi:Lon protease-like protein
MPINRPFEKLLEIPSVIPVFPLPGVLLLPRGELPLNIFEPRYVSMIDDAMKSDRLIGILQPAISQPPMGVQPALEDVGCLGKISQLAETGDGRYILNLTGIIRFRVADELSAVTPYRKCRIDSSEFEGDLAPGDEEAVDRQGLIQAFKRFAKLKELQVDWSGVQAAPTEALVNSLAMMSPFGAADKQALLEATDLRVRVATLIAIADMAGSDDAGSSTLH